MLSELPLETIDEIVDHLHDDRAALIACSLTASAFVPASRHHLFSKVVLDCSSICVFLRMLDVPWSTIAPAITRLVISERKSLRGAPQKKKKAGHYKPTNPLRLRSHLQGVNSVRFSDISLADIPPPFWHLLNDLKGVKNLEAHQMVFHSPTQFFQYICSLPALEALSISSSSWDALPSDLAQFRPKVPFCIPLLDVGRHSQHGILEWFLSQKPVPPVHTFRINLESGSATISMIRDYIDATGASIQHLHISLPSGIPDIQRLGGVDFAPCTDVKSIHIEGLRISSQQTQSRSLENFMNTLFSRVKSPHLSEVSISLTMDAANDAFAFFGIPDHLHLQLFDWGQLPEILEENLGTNLKKLGVAVRHYPRYQHSWSEQFIRKGPFRLFNERQVLHIDFPDPPIMDSGFWPGLSTLGAGGGLLRIPDL